MHQPGPQARRRRRPGRLLLIALACLALGFWAGTRFERFMQVDRCLDAGGRFDHERGWCER